MGYLTPNYVEHVVGSDVKRFYPISVKAMFRLRQIGKLLARSLSVLFQPTDRQGNTISAHPEDCSTTSEVYKDPDGTKVEKTSVGAVSLDVARLRSEERARAFEELVDALSDEKNLYVVVGIMADSLRDEFERPVGDGRIKEVVDTIDLEVLSQYLVGVMKANAKVLTPFLELFRTTRSLIGDEAGSRSEKIVPLTPTGETMTRVG